jgi:hypothetical protein
MTLSDLDPQLVTNRETGYFQSCFPPRRPVRRPVFPSKEGSTDFCFQGGREHHVVDQPKKN